MTLRFKRLINDARRRRLLKLVNGCLERFYIATFTNDQLDLLRSPKVGTMRAYAQETNVPTIHLRLARPSDDGMTSTRSLENMR